MTIVGTQCANCPPTAHVQQNNVGAVLPGVTPATPTASSATEFPQVVYDVYTDGVVLYLNDDGATWTNTVISNTAPNDFVLGTTTANNYDTTTDAGVADPNTDAGSLHAAPVDNDTFWQQFGNGFLFAKHDGTSWQHVFASSCCPDVTINAAAGDFTDAEAPLSAEVLVAYPNQGIGTQVTYTSPLGKYFTWIYDPAGNPIPHETLINGDRPWAVFAAAQADTTSQDDVLISDSIYHNGPMYRGASTGVDSTVADTEYFEARGMLIVGAGDHTVNTASDAGSASDGNSLIVGRGNDLTGGVSTLSGKDNTADGYYNLVGGNLTNTTGNYNIVSGAGTVVTGDYNITNAFSGSTIVGDMNVNVGQNNDLTGNQNAVFGFIHAVTGSGNGIFGQNNDTTGTRNLAGGLDNDILNATQQALVCGRQNTCDASNNTILSGQSCTATDSPTSLVTGSGNISTTNVAIALSGNNNNVSTSNSSIVGGQDHVITGSSTCVAGGTSHTITSAGNSAIFGNNNNVSGGGSLVAGTNNNCVGDTNIIGGASCLSTDAATENSLIVGFDIQGTGSSESTLLGAYVRSTTGKNFVANYLGGAANLLNDTGPNSFTVRASNYQLSTDITETAGVTMAAGTSAWVAISDSATKKDISVVNHKEILNLATGLNVKTWKSKSDPNGQTQIGIMADEFNEVFSDVISIKKFKDSHAISHLDVDGVLWACIKALTEETNELKEQINALKKIS